MSILYKHRGKHFGPTLFVFEASHMLVDNKNIHFVIMRFKG